MGRASIFWPVHTSSSYCKIYLLPTGCRSHWACASHVEMLSIQALILWRMKGPLGIHYYNLVLVVQKSRQLQNSIFLLILVFSRVAELVLIQLRVLLVFLADLVLLRVLVVFLADLVLLRVLLIFLADSRYRYEYLFLSSATLLITTRLLHN